MHFVIRTPNQVYMQNLSQIGEPARPQIFDLAPFLRSIALKHGKTHGDAVINTTTFLRKKAYENFPKRAELPSKPILEILDSS